MKIFKSREGSHNMQCCCYGEVQRRLRARRQCLLGKDSVVEDPSENKVCSLHYTYQCPWVGLRECHKSHGEQLSKQCLLSGISSAIWESKARLHLYLWQFSVCFQHRAHSSCEATMSFCKGMKQPLADLQLLQPETKETASEWTLWHTSEDLKHVRGRCTTVTDDKTHKNRLFIFFCKEGVKKLRDLMGMAKTKANTV